MITKRRVSVHCCTTCILGFKEEEAEHWQFNCMCACAAPRNCTVRLRRAHDIEQLGAQGLPRQRPLVKIWSKRKKIMSMARATETSLDEEHEKMRRNIDALYATLGSASSRPPSTPSYSSSAAGGAPPTPAAAAAGYGVGTRGLEQARWLLHPEAALGARAYTHSYSST